MTTVKRTLPGDVETEIAEQQTVPFYLVKIEFASGTGYYSESYEVTFETNVYIEGGVRIGSFSWTPDGGQRGTIALQNENDAATALVLNNVVQDVPVTIYQTYKTSGGNTTPVIYSRGVLNGSQITPKESVLGVLTSAAATEFAPRDFFTQEEGYNWLPADGTVVQWNNEKYVLVAENG